MNQKTIAEDEGELVCPKSIDVLLISVDSEKLSQAAKKGKRSSRLEAILRLHDHLKLFSIIPGDWAIALEGEARNKKITVILTARASV